jgi:hypothetical protein
MRDGLLPVSSRGWRAAAVFLAAAAACIAAPAQEDLRCLSCHGKPGFRQIRPSGEILELFVDPTLLRQSVHGKNACVDCHADVDEVPHAERPGRVNCRRCHYEGSTAGVPQTPKYMEFERSVHGRELAVGNPKAPLCQDCHGDHMIVPGSDPRSSVNRAHVTQVCGACHLKVYGEYRASIHGRALDRGEKDAPVCTHCHGEHTIARPEDRSSSVNPANVGNTCAQCHAKVFIMEKYGVQVQQVATYRDSFHGIANEFGDLKAANCASCHRAHLILPSADPLSSVNVQNIPATCGKCHPGANANFAKGRIHLNPKDRSAGIVYWVALGFEILTISTLTGLFIHIGLDLFRQYRSRRRRETSPDGKGEGEEKA